MKEKAPLNVEKLANRWKRFFKNNIPLAIQNIREHIANKPDITEAELFQLLSYDNGKKKPHMSSVKDGTLTLIQKQRRSRSPSTVHKNPNRPSSVIRKNK